MLAARILALMALAIGLRTSAHAQFEGARGGTLPDLVLSAARIVEASVVEIHVLTDVPGGTRGSGRSLRVAELDVVRPVIGSSDERRVFLRLDEDDPEHLALRKGGDPSLWILKADRGSLGRGTKERQRCAELTKGKLLFSIHGLSFARLPVRALAGVACVDFDARRFELPPSLAASVKRDAKHVHARWVPRAELFDLLRALREARGMPCELTTFASGEESSRVRVGWNLVGVATDVQGRQRSIQVTPDEIGAFHAVVEREHFHELPCEVGAHATDARPTKSLRVDTERGAQIVELFDPPGALASSEERDRYERAQRVVDAYEALVARAVERVEPRAR